MIKLYLLYGEEFSTHGNNCLDYIPTVGSKIIYKTFRENENYKGKVFNYTLQVIDIVYETQETWNNCYYPTIVKVIVKILKHENA